MKKSTIIILTISAILLGLVGWLLKTSNELIFRIFLLLSAILIFIAYIGATKKAKNK